MAIIGGALQDLSTLEQATQQTGEEAGEFYETVRSRADTFNGDIDAMAERLRADVEEFGALVEERAGALVRTAEATEWHGLAADAKRERTAAMHGRASAFQAQELDNVESFRAELRALVDRYYDHVAGAMASTVADMQDVHVQEAQHTQHYHQALQDIDQQFAG